MTELQVKARKGYGMAIDHRRWITARAIPVNIGVGAVNAVLVVLLGAPWRWVNLGAVMLVVGMIYIQATRWLPEWDRRIEWWQEAVARADTLAQWREE